MSALPIIDAPNPRPSGGKSAAAMLLRLVMVLLIAVAIRLLHEQRSAASATATTAVEISAVQQLIPAAETFGPPSGNLLPVLAADDAVLGYAATTMPAAADVVGYRGPSNVLLILNAQSSVIEAALLNSDDTPEHVAAILRDESFFTQFAGWTQGQPDTFCSIDATSGATLTGLAIAEGIAVRLGSEKPSLRFPDPLDAHDLSLVFDNAESLQLRPVDLVEAEVLSAAGIVVGRLIRSGPLVDSVAGYQGPSEVVAAVTPEGMIAKIALRRTYDNEPYAGYLNDEPYFWKPFLQKSFAQLQQMDVQAEQIEGVSGATMTSLAVADTIVAIGRKYVARQSQATARNHAPRLRWTNHDTGTVVVLCCGIVIAMTRLRGRRWVRIVWNIILVTYFGLVTGNLISLAIVMGWAAQGIAWRLAPGLAVVVVVSLLLPSSTKRNIYCSHLCPHGAAQQLLKNRWKFGPRISAAWSRRLVWIPGTILLIAVVATVFGSTWNLAAWEPFNAYIWYVAGAASLSLAVGSLALSSSIPMAYCRYGCATGRLLDYLRRSAASAKFQLADGVVVSVAILAWTLVLWT